MCNYRFHRFQVLAAILALALSVLVGNAQAEEKPAPVLTVTEVDLMNQAHNRPTKLRVWFQQSAEACDATVCLTENQASHRVALISHGAFGSPREMNWLGFALASQGWVAVGVAHFGESWVYGPETINPSTAGRFWQRPQDVSFAIDSLANPGLFNKAINTSKVLMLGHSAGGFTSLALAGAKLDAGRSKAYCATAQAKVDKGCHYVKQNKQPPMTANMLKKVGRLQDQMIDPRIAAVIALDPAFGHAVSQQSLNKVRVPTLVVGSVDNDFLPFEAHAKYFADKIDQSTLIGIEQGAGHFVYIDSCDSKRDAMGVPLCVDRLGVDRKSVQRQVMNHIFSFIYQNQFG